MTKKLSKKVFIERSIKIHKNKYNYSLVEYKNNKTKVKIICSEHGVFEQKPNDHLSGRGCSSCSNTKKKTTKDFIKESKIIHGDKYDYTLVEYKGNKIEVNIICKEHGIFKQIPKSHLNNHGCLRCAYIQKNNKKSTKQFIIDAQKIHGDKYDYFLVDYINSTLKIKIICKEHGIFEQTPTNHLCNHGCPKCNESKGEKTIRNILIDKNLIFEPQKKFKNCCHKLSLPFDFYLPEYNLCIEYDGEQHFKSIKHWGGNKNLRNIQKRDQIKNIYCKDNNIKLIRIKYNENIKETLIPLLKMTK